MANTYILRYYKDIHPNDGTDIRVEFHQKLEIKPDAPVIPIAEPMLGQEIGAVVQSLHLQIQGQQADIDTPIVKTSLSMTFVDAPDLNDGRKNGMWEEFYTSDATMWKVVVMYKFSYQDVYKTIWGGYITPDSFSEELTYRGSIGLVARDNLGHMQDFPFDLVGDDVGMIRLSELVEGALAKIETPMELDWTGEGHGLTWPSCVGQSLPDVKFNVSAFEDMTCYEAVEKALYACGCVMRWVGRNKLHICPLKDLPKHGYPSYIVFGKIKPQFLAGARRELVPAVKTINEVVKYDVGEMEFKKVEKDDFTGAIEKFHVVGNSVDLLGISNPIANKEVGKGWCNPDLSLFFDPSKHEFGKEDNDDLQYMWVSANNYFLSTIGARYAEYSRAMRAESVTLNLRFGSSYYFATNGKLYSDGDAIKMLHLVVMAQQNGITSYLQPDGSWNVTAKRLEIAMSGGALEMYIDMNELNGPVTLRVQIHGIITKASEKSIPRYLPLYSASFTSGKGLMQKNTVTTHYNDLNNVAIKREPDFGPAYNAVAFPEIIKNGFYIGKSASTFNPAKRWTFDGQDFVELAVLVHKQLLCYFAKPNNLISGTITNIGMMFPECNFEWGGAEHMLASGSWNLLNLHLESAVIREFTRYEDMWKDALPAGYKPLDYIENTGSGYIDTGIVIASLNASVEVDCQFMSLPTSSAEMAWGYSKNSSFIPRWCLAAHSGKWYGSPNITTTTGTADKNRHTFELSVGSSASGSAVYRGKIDGATLYSDTAMNYPADFAQNNMPIYLFSRNNQGTADLFGKCRIYGFKVWKDGILAHDLRPCENNAGTLGFYDVVGQRFSSAMGSGLVGSISLVSMEESVFEV